MNWELSLSRWSHSWHRLFMKRGSTGFLHILEISLAKALAFSSKASLQRV
jgi:hypothetical protein